MKQRFFGRCLQVIGGRGAQLCSQCGTCARSKLLGVHANAETVLFRRFHHNARFFNGECMIVAERIAVTREAG